VIRLAMSAISAQISRESTAGTAVIATDQMADMCRRPAEPTTIE